MLLRAWRGEVSLPGYLGLYLALLAACACGYGVVAAGLLPPSLSTALDIATSASLAGASLPIVIGLNRRLDASARTPAQRRLAHAAGWLAIFGAMYVGTVAVGDGYRSLSVDLERLTGETEAGARVFAGPGGGDVRLRGTLTEGTAARLEAILAATPGARRVNLSSDGGLVEEGEAIGKAIRARNLDTYVPDVCSSACTIAFAGGRERLLSDGARLGFHAAYVPGLFGRRFETGQEDLRGIYVSAGLDPGFVSEALSTPGTEIWEPDHARLKSAGVVTGTVAEDDMPSTTLDGGDGPAEARAAALARVPLLAALDPDAAVAPGGPLDLYARAYRAGLTEGEAVSRMGLAALSGARAAVGAGDDATALAAGRTVLAAMRLLASAGEEAECVATGATAHLGRAADALAEHLRDAAFQRLGRLRLRPPAAVPAAADEPESPGVTCRDLVALYASAIDATDGPAAVRDAVAHAHAPAKRNP